MFLHQILALFKFNKTKHEKEIALRKNASAFIFFSSHFPNTPQLLNKASAGFKEAGSIALYLGSSTLWRVSLCVMEITCVAFGRYSSKFCAATPCSQWLRATNVNRISIQLRRATTSSHAHLEANSSIHQKNADFCCL